MTDWRLRVAANPGSGLKPSSSPAGSGWPSAPAGRLGCSALRSSRRHRPV